MSDSTFIATMVDLRRLDTALTADSAARADMRGAVLERRGVTLADLERAATALAKDGEHAGRVFGKIDSIVARRDTAGRSLPANVAPPAARPPTTTTTTTTPTRPGGAAARRPAPGGATPSRPPVTTRPSP